MRQMAKTDDQWDRLEEIERRLAPVSSAGARDGLIVGLLFLIARILLGIRVDIEELADDVSYLSRKR